MGGEGERKRAGAGWRRRGGKEERGDGVSEEQLSQTEMKRERL